MIKFLKISALAFVLAFSLTLCAYAANFDELKEAAVASGVEADVIGNENDLVKSESAEKFLRQYADFEADFEGEYTRTADYLTAVLNIMGFSPERGDFLAEFPYDKAAQVGVLKSLSPDSSYLNNFMMLDYAIAAKNPGEASEILGLKYFYDPSISDDSVESFSVGFGAFETVSSNKFSVSVTQGAGTYHADVKQVASVSLSDNMEIIAGSYFAAYVYSGADISLEITLNDDIFEGYKIYSDKTGFSDSFSNGVLSVLVTEPQILKVCFDEAVGKTITVFIGKTGETEASDIGKLLLGDIDNALINTKNAEVSYVCKTKIYIGNTVVYYPAIIRNSEVYISDELYAGEYSGEGYENYNGDIYLPISAFVGNGNIAAAKYDSERGVVTFTLESTASSVSLNKFTPCSSDGTSMAITGDAVKFENTDTIGVKGLMASIDAEAFMTEKCLRITSRISMEGKKAGVPLKLAILGYDSCGNTDVFSEAMAKAYNSEYETTVYFDISKLDGAYENYYLIISCEEAPGVVVTMRGTALSVFEASSDIGDNEFNPF